VRYNNIETGEMSDVYRWVELSNLIDMAEPHGKILLGKRGELEPSIPVADIDDPVLLEIENALAALEEAAGLADYQQ
jgi:hypothetical protein